ncbi:hypothetical protein O3P69_001474 [Scylla paramamosain]|uniref:BTB domain-containing protein n=1 Tax=Scylla paramamosain TaxID=85552 RepID=A0AAW0UXR5_SCYPA
MVDAGMQNKDDGLLDLQLMWTSHVEVLLQVMQALRHKEVFADATLICGNKRFEVHQFVLSTCSLYLETLFRISPGDHPVLMFPDASPTAMEQLLDFMYLGQTDLTSAELDQLLDLAEDLRIIGLMHSSSKSHNQSQTTINQEVKKEKAVVNKNKSATSVNKSRSAAAAKKTPKRVTKIKSQTSSVNQKVIKDHALASKDQGKASVDRSKGAPTGGKRPKKTTEKKILQDNEKNTSMKSISAKESEKNKEEQILHAEPVAKTEMPLHAEPVATTKMPLQAEPASENEMPLQTEPVSKNEMSLQAEPVVKTEMPLQADPVSKNEVSLQAEPVAKIEVPPQAEPISKNKMSLQAEPVAKTGVSLQAEPVAKMEMQLEAEPVAKIEMPQQFRWPPLRCSHHHHHIDHRGLREQREGVSLSVRLHAGAVSGVRRQKYTILGGTLPIELFDL